MLFWTMKITIISIIFIFLIHHILVFFKTNLTTPKIKDLVNAPIQKYDTIFNAINSNAMNSTNISELLPPAPPLDMKNELKQFMKKQFKENNNPIDSSNLSSNSSIQYSTY